VNGRQYQFGVIDLPSFFGDEEEISPAMKT